MKFFTPKVYDGKYIKTVTFHVVTTNSCGSEEVTEWHNIVAYGESDEQLQAIFLYV